jgi:hypothetical protein
MEIEIVYQKCNFHKWEETILNEVTYGPYYKCA